MKQIIGECKFCHQSMTIEVPDDYTDDQVIEEVTKRCSCPEASGEVKIGDLITFTEAKVKEIFKEKSVLEDAEKLMLWAVKSIATSRIDKITISRGAYTAQMTRSAKGIKIKLEQKTEQVEEATAK